jgi:hypothetical protein
MLLKIPKNVLLRRTMPFLFVCQLQLCGFQSSVIVAYLYLFLFEVLYLGLGFGKFVNPRCNEYGPPPPTAPSAGVEPGTLHILSKHSTPEFHCQPLGVFWGSLCSQDGLELIVLALPPSAGITDVHYHTWQVLFLKTLLPGHFTCFTLSQPCRKPHDGCTKSHSLCSVGRQGAGT